jgi:hypothetical protein
MDRARAIADSARRRGRPVAVALTVSASDRNQLGEGWKVIGAIATEFGATASASSLDPGAAQVITTVDSGATALWAQRVSKWGLDKAPRSSVDPVYRYLSGVLSCPRYVLDSSLARARGISLDSLCNFR